MSIDLSAWIAELKQREIELWVDGEQLRYRAPEGRMTAEIRDQLKSNRDQVFEFLRADKSFPLSFSQQRMWLLERVFPTKHLNNAAEAYEFKGDLNFDALQRSLREIVHRHSLLRALLVSDAEPPAMVVSQDRELALPLKDLAHLPNREKEDELQTRIWQEQILPFDLTTEAGFRPSLFHLDPNHHVLLLTYHHLYIDGWSSGRLFRELSLLYNAFAQDADSPLPPLATQYGDFAHEQQRHRSLGISDSSEYWRQKLTGLAEELRLPYDYALQPEWGQADSVRSMLPTGLARRLRDLAHDIRGVTLSSVLLAGLATHLFTVSRQRDLVIGVVSSFRGAPGYEDLIGPFLNVLPIRIRPAPDQTFVDLLSRVHESTIEAVTHQEVPLDVYASSLSVDQDVVLPKVRITLNVHNFPAIHATGLDGLDTRRFPLKPVATYSDLEFLIGMIDDESIQVRTIYDRTLFSKETAAAISRAFEETLLFGAENPDATLSEFPVPPLEDAQPIRVAHAPSSGVIPLRTATERRLAALWSEVLGVEHVNASDSFFELGGRSLAAVRLLEKVSVEFGREPRVEIFFESPQLSSMAAYLDARDDDGEPRLLLNLQDQGDAAPLFVVPGIGGSAFRILALAEVMAPSHPLWVFQSPGLVDPELIPETLEQIASAYVDAMRECQPVGPYHISGYSHGGLVAYEMARQLQASGGQLGRLTMIDTVASEVDGFYGSLGRTGRVRFRLQQAQSTMTRPARYIASSRFRQHYSIMKTLPKRDRFPYLRSRELRQEARRIHRDANPNLVSKAPKRHFDIVKAHDRAFNRYRFEPVDFPIELIASSWNNRYSIFGWNLLCPRVKTFVVPGDHTSIMNAPRVQEVAEILKKLAG